ncbi:MAG: response regulator transcription factor [Gemmatimonadota bacterium]
MRAEILIVEDERDIAMALGENLELEGHRVTFAETGTEGVAAAQRATPSLVILDLMLPDTPGEAVLRQLRAHGFIGPVLILSARQGEIDKVRGFRLGADDYVTKPFGLLELLARIDALLRRTLAPHDRSTMTFGHLTLDVAGMRAFHAGTEISLRPKERDLLFALIERAGQAISREELLRDVWGYSAGVDSRTVDWHVAELRRKLMEDPARPSLIRTVRKVGYQLVLDRSAPLSSHT